MTETPCHTCGALLPHSRMFHVRFSSDPRARLHDVCPRCVHERKIPVNSEFESTRARNMAIACVVVGVLAIVWPNDALTCIKSPMDYALYVTMGGALGMTWIES